MFKPLRILSARPARLSSVINVTPARRSLASIIDNSEVLANLIKRQIPDVPQPAPSPRPKSTHTTPAPEPNRLEKPLPHLIPICPPGIVGWVMAGKPYSNGNPRWYATSVVPRASQRFIVVNCYQQQTGVHWYRGNCEIFDTGAEATKSAHRGFVDTVFDPVTKRWTGKFYSCYRRGLYAGNCAIVIGMVKASECTVMFFTVPEEGTLVGCYNSEAAAYTALEKFAGESGGVVKKDPQYVIEVDLQNYAPGNLEDMCPETVRGEHLFTMSWMQHYRISGDMEMEVLATVGRCQTLTNGNPPPCDTVDMFTGEPPRRMIRRHDIGYTASEVVPRALINDIRVLIYTLNKLAAPPGPTQLPGFDILSLIKPRHI